MFLRFPGNFVYVFPFFRPRKGQHVNKFDPHPFLGQSQEVVYVYSFFRPPNKCFTQYEKFRKGVGRQRGLAEEILQRPESHQASFLYPFSLCPLGRREAHFWKLSGLFFWGGVCLSPTPSRQPLSKLLTIGLEQRERQTCQEPLVDIGPNMVPTFCEGFYQRHTLQPSRVYLRLRQNKLSLSTGCPSGRGSEKKLLRSCVFLSPFLHGQFLCPGDEQVITNYF